MFKNKRMMTRRIANELPFILQVAIWTMIDDMSIEQDYLQVFILSEENGKQKIIHQQEQPQYERVYLMDTDSPCLSAKVYVIDDETHSTMLFSDEY